MREDEDSDHQAIIAANQHALVRFAWIFGAGLALALTVPGLFFAAIISSFLALAAGVMATIAVFARDDIFAPCLSRWDIAAALYTMSLFAGFFVDLEDIRFHLMLHHSIAQHWQY